jgi:hypothetical protein
LVHFVFIWYIFSSFGIMLQEKSGNPDPPVSSRHFYSKTKITLISMYVRFLHCGRFCDDYNCINKHVRFCTVVVFARNCVIWLKGEKIVSKSWQEWNMYITYRAYIGTYFNVILHDIGT